MKHVLLRGKRNVLVKATFTLREKRKHGRSVTEAQSAQEVQTATGSSCYIIVTELQSEEIYMDVLLKIFSSTLRHQFDRLVVNVFAINSHHFYQQTPTKRRTLAPAFIILLSKSCPCHKIANKCGT
jgi:hypothetical protein